MFVKNAYGRIIRDSRNENTIQIILSTHNGKYFCSSPSGKSTGKYEVPCYNSSGIKKSLLLLNKFCESLKNKNFILKTVKDLEQVQTLIDLFEKKNGKLGGNTTYVIHGVFLKAAAGEKNKEVWEFIYDDMYKDSSPKIPMPIGNCIGGGLHSKHIKMRRPDFQEFLLIAEEDSFSKAISKNIRAYESSRTLLKTTSKNDESAWRTNKNNEDTLNILKTVADKYGLKIGLDIAASTFFNGKLYDYKHKNLDRDSSEQTDYMSRLVEKYNIFYLEDPLDENDFLGFKNILDNVKSRGTLIVGDDLTATNFERLVKAVSLKSINAIIVKPNQVGSLLEVKRVIEFCKKRDIKIIFSHRSGETMDTLFSDLAVGFGADYVKCGIMGKERLIKHKRIIDIEDQIKSYKFRRN